MPGLAWLSNVHGLQLGASGKRCEGNEPFLCSLRSGSLEARFSLPDLGVLSGDSARKRLCSYCLSKIGVFCFASLSLFFFFLNL